MYLLCTHVCSPLVQFLYILPHVPNESLLLIFPNLQDHRGDGSRSAFLYLPCRAH